MKEKYKKLLTYALMIYIVVGGLVMVEIIEDIRDIQILSLWQTGLLLSPAYVVCGYGFIVIVKEKIKRDRVKLCENIFCNAPRRILKSGSRLKNMIESGSREFIWRK